MPVNMNLAALYMNENGEYKPIPGVRGEPGVTPTVSVTDITGGHRLTITDINGDKTVDVMNGAKGDKVIHNGKHWTSDVDGNVWEPGVYGWSEAE